METAQRTPSPWTWSRNIGLRSTKPESIHGPNGEIVLSWGHERNDYGQENTVLNANPANARLIIAAPELLSICDTVGEWLTKDHADRMNGRMRGDLANWVLAELSAAVTKAKG